MRNIIITYFDPFEGRRTNASKEIAYSLTDEKNLVRLPVSWRKVPYIIDSVLEEKPLFLIMLGEAPSYEDVVIETNANNICVGVDNYEEKKNNDPIIKDGQSSLNTNFLVDENKFKTSKDAGKYLCNYAYYCALAKSQFTKTILIHVPLLHNKGVGKRESITKSIKELINNLLELNNHSFIAPINGVVKEFSEENILDTYEEFKKEYDLPNIIMGKETIDNVSTITARAEGYEQLYEEKGVSIIDEDKVIKKLKFLVAYTLRTNLTILKDLEKEKNKKFSIAEYNLLDKPIKDKMIQIIMRENYNDELSFFKELDNIYNSMLLNTKEEKENLNRAKEYISILGMDRCKLILLDLAKRM